MNFYAGKTPVKFNTPPEDEAVERLKDLIRGHGKWAEPHALSLSEETSDGCRDVGAGARERARATS